MTMFPIVLVLGKSGSGKSTMIDSVLSRNASFGYLRTYTTRRPRSRLELEHGKEYTFVSREVYKQLRCASAGWDHTEVHGEYYGVDIAETMLRLKSKTLMLAVFPSVEVVDSMRRAYANAALKTILVDRATRVTRRALLERGASDSVRRAIHEEDLGLDTIRHSIDRVFVPENSIAKDCERFYNLVTELASKS